MSESRFAEGLERAAQIPGKIEGLVGAGMGMDALAQAFGVSEATVKSWQKGAVPTEKSYDTLEVLVGSVQTMTDAGIESESATTWLQTPLQENFPDAAVPVCLAQAPLELAREHPDALGKLVDLVFVKPASD